jgi:hypothetical protein
MLRSRPVVNLEAEVKFLPEGQGKIDIGNKSCTIRYLIRVTSRMHVQLQYMFLKFFDKLYEILKHNLRVLFFDL